MLLLHSWLWNWILKEMICILVRVISRFISGLDQKYSINNISYNLTYRNVLHFFPWATLQQIVNNVISLAVGWFPTFRQSWWHHSHDVFVEFKSIFMSISLNLWGQSYAGYVRAELRRNCDTVTIMLIFFML